MTFRFPPIVFLFLAAIFAARLSAQEVSVYVHLSDSIVHLDHGDSVEFQALGPAVVPNEPAGLLVTYYAFVAIDDSSKLRSIALEFFRALLPRLKSVPPFVVMRAVNVRAARRNSPGYYDIQQYGFVFERRADGRWYFLHEAQPIQAP